MSISSALVHVIYNTIVIISDNNNRNNNNSSNDDKNHKHLFFCEINNLIKNGYKFCLIIIIIIIIYKFNQNIQENAPKLQQSCGYSL